MANVSKGSCPKWTFINIRPFHTSTGSNRNNFSINQNHHGRPQAKFNKSKILTFSEIGHVTSAQFYNYKTSSQPFLNNFRRILSVLRCLSQNKKFPTWKTAEPQRLSAFIPVIISAQGRMARWLDGGRCVKEKLSKINFYQQQTLSNITIDKYKQLFNQQKPSRPSRDGSDRASEANKIFAKISTETLTKPIRIFFPLLKHACLSF